jgi:hypothetical protein
LTWQQQQRLLKLLGRSRQFSVAAMLPVYPAIFFLCDLISVG